MRFIVFILFLLARGGLGFLHTSDGNFKPDSRTHLENENDDDRIKSDDHDRDFKLQVQKEDVSKESSDRDQLQRLKDKRDLSLEQNHNQDQLPLQSPRSRVPDIIKYLQESKLLTGKLQKDSTTGRLDTAKLDRTNTDNFKRIKRPDSFRSELPFNADEADPDLIDHRITGPETMNQEATKNIPPLDEDPKYQTRVNPNIDAMLSPLQIPTKDNTFFSLNGKSQLVNKLEELINMLKELENLIPSLCDFKDATFGQSLPNNKMGLKGNCSAAKVISNFKNDCSNFTFYMLLLLLLLGTFGTLMYCYDFATRYRTSKQNDHFPNKGLGISREVTQPIPMNPIIPKESGNANSGFIMDAKCRNFSNTTEESYVDEEDDHKSIKSLVVRPLSKDWVLDMTETKEPVLMTRAKMSKNTSTVVMENGI